ncbi:MAG TPA: cysteine peptidase family C39 domain-containing protein [Sedimentisphaerales bacterium]|nr:cysteine peptidase family C39 domain-containing protein [Sedimentisphaerales bacterium]
MKKAMVKTIVLTSILAVCSQSWADRPLEQAEIIELFENLTAQPRATWIPSGTIEAVHIEFSAAKTTDEQEITEAINRETQAYLDNPSKPQQTEELQKMKVEAIPFNVRYKLSNEHTMVSNVVLRYDGDRFFWLIDVESRTDSLAPAAELADNSFTTEFNLRWNKLRLFAWDGEKCVRYYRPGNNATIWKERSGVRGPLTAGVIPWGYGMYSLEELTNAESSASEVESDAGPEIHLTLIKDETEESFVLDPAKAYAVKWYSASVSGDSLTVQSYEDYQSVGDCWCPSSITIEKYDTSGESPRLLTRDNWSYTAVTKGELAAESFVVDFEYDAFIEDYRFGDTPLQFRFLPPEEPSARNVDVNKLLQDRLELLYSPELAAAQNCATVALKYACGELGIHVPWRQLARSVHGVRKTTTLLEMQQLVRSAGLDCAAVKTDLKGLGTLDDCQVILHLPQDNHYVVLAGIDDKYVRLIDLDRNTFYYRNHISHFENIWDGAALVVFNKPTAALSGLARIEDNRLGQITGACESCTDVIQVSSTSGCGSSPCGGTEVHQLLRKGCESAASGSCSESSMATQESAPCAISSSTGLCEPGSFTESGSIWACS